MVHEGVLGCWLEVAIQQRKSKMVVTEVPNQVLGRVGCGWMQDQAMLRQARR